MTDIPTAARFLTDVAEDIHHRNRTAGWYDKPREDGTMMMLMVSEIAEAMEGNRKDLMDDHLPHRKMEEVEMADTIIRILDYCGYKGFDIGAAVDEKLTYNANREDHKRENRAKEGGKAY